MVNTFDFKILKQYTPLSPLSGQELKWWGNTKGTSCCYKLSFGLNALGPKIPARSFWRPNHVSRVDGVLLYHLMAVNEVERYLDTVLKWDSENIKNGDTKRGRDQQMAYLQGKYGVLLFWEPPAGLHVELWDNTKMNQPNMSPGMFTRATSVWFYETSNH